MPKETIREHFEVIAADYDRWKEKSAYYYRLLAGIYRERVPEGASVLEIGCGTGTLLNSLRPARGVGIDISPRMVEIAASKFPGLSFLAADAESFDLGESFQYIIVPDVIEHLTDVPAMFRSARKHLRPDGRLVLTCVNPLWAPVLHLAERFALKMPEGEHRWLSGESLRRMASESGLGLAENSGRVLCPKEIPLAAPLLNGAAGRFAFLRGACLIQVLVHYPLRPAAADAPASGGRAR